MTEKIAVVLFNLGGPDSLRAVRPFLFNLFNDKAIIGLPQPFRWALATSISWIRDRTAQAIYAKMGGASPLVKETEAQRLALQATLSEKLPDAEIMVVTAMRYWRPFTDEAAKAVAAFGPDRIVLLPLYPQYSTTTTGSSLDAWREVYRGVGQTYAVCCYPEAEGLVEAHAAKIRETLLSAEQPDPIRVIFSAHGLPQKIVDAGDPYQQQVERTAGSVAQRLGVQDWKVSYQSRVGPMKWLGPSTIEALEEAGRDGVGVLVVPIAFVSEHSETLVELDIDYRELAERAGVPVYLRAPALGIEPHFIAALADMVTSALAGGPIAPQSTPCQGRFSRCPMQCERAAA